MKWKKKNGLYELEGTKLSLEFYNISSKLYAKLFYDGKLMRTFPYPIKNQKMLKESIITLCGNYDMNVDIEIFTTDLDWADKVRDELTMISRCVSIN